MFLPLSFILLLGLPFFALGDKEPSGGQCDQENTKLEAGSYELAGDCGSTDYCATNGTCVPKGCRKDEFPFGYVQGSHFPKLCNPGFFCPDEGDQCQPLQPVGGDCQLNRDDQCTPPSDSADLTDFPNNVNGAVCLNFKCFWANVSEGLPCELENTPYIAYTADSEFAFVVSRGNCRPGLYCDASTSSHVCVQKKALAATCDADKECISNNCGEDNTCALPADAPAHFPMWVYIVVGVGIFAGMAFTMVALFFVHRRARDEDREKRTQYWREQTALRQNIIHLKETARSGYGRDNNDPPSHLASGDSQIPMLSGRSNLRNNLSDDDRDEGEYPGLINTTAHKRRISRPGRR